MIESCTKKRMLLGITFLGGLVFSTLNNRLLQIRIVK